MTADVNIDHNAHIHRATHHKWALQNGTLGRTGALLIIAIIAGDFLLWGYYPSIALALFLALLVGLQLVNSRSELTRNLALKTLVLAGIGLVPLIETMNFLTVVIALGTTFAACFFTARKLPDGWAARMDELVFASLMSFFRLPQFLFGLSHTSIDGSWRGRVLQWIIPVLFAGIFVVLFVEASPVWERWLSMIDLTAILGAIFSARALFWLSVAWFALPFIQRAHPVKRLFGRWSLRTDAAKATQVKPNHVSLILRCLVLVNIVFAFQTGLDATYLWAGAELPRGMTYASYAHRGAYPLVAASLLAGAFVIVAMRPGGAGEQSSMVKWLVLLWIGQNLLLLGSSVERLLLYVDQYSLTYWRLAAFIWMTLVAGGLVLIIVRFVTGRSTGWLVGANAVMLAVTLYATALVNFPHVIASYNLTKYKNGAPNFDFHYLRRLGPLALPAVVEFSGTGTIPPYLKKTETKFRRDAPFEIGTNWREWSFRGQRLAWFVESYENAKKSEKRRLPTETFSP